MKIYLAAPYTSNNPEICEARVELASMAAAKLMELGFVVFSPITHGHQVASHLPEEKQNSHTFWMQQCLPILGVCDVLVVLPLEGWDNSKGITAELEFAEHARIPVFYWQLPAPLTTIKREDVRTISLETIQGIL